MAGCSRLSKQVQELQALTPPKVRLKPWRRLDKGMAVDALRANMLKLCNVEVWQSCSIQYFDDGVLVDIGSDTDVEGCVGHRGAWGCVTHTPRWKMSRHFNNNIRHVMFQNHENGCV